MKRIHTACHSDILLETVSGKASEMAQGSVYLISVGLVNQRARELSWASRGLSQKKLD